jgi:hypothetical protein
VPQAIKKQLAQDIEKKGGIALFGNGQPYQLSDLIAEKPSVYGGDLARPIANVVNYWKSLSDKSYEKSVLLKLGVASHKQLLSTKASSRKVAPKSRKVTEISYELSSEEEEDSENEFEPDQTYRNAPVDILNHFDPRIPGSSPLGKTISTRNPSTKKKSQEPTHVTMSYPTPNGYTHVGAH